MDKIHITQNQFSDLLNLLNDVFFPLKNFVTKLEFLQIINNKKYKNHFYPLPIYFGINKKTFLTFLTFHPAYLLRQPDQKKFSWEDLKIIRKKIDELKIKL